jgi:hypothetical protein
MFRYGRAVRYLPGLAGLKDRYFNLKFQPRYMVHALRLELSSLGLRGRTSPSKFSVGDRVLNFL